MPGRLKLGLSILAVLVVIIAIGEWSSSDPTDIAPKATPAPSHTTQSVREEAAPSLQAAEVFDSSVVARHLGGNKLGIVATDLMTKKNPKGEGFFVYVPKTRFSGVERLVLWLVLDDRAYPLNGPSKDTTPNLPWPREADQQSWAKTGLNPYSPNEAIAIVFGGQ
jgi:hypothetical protein